MVRELTDRSRLLVPLEPSLGTSIGSCAAGPRTSGSGAQPTCSTVRFFADSQVALFVAKLHRRKARYGWFVTRQTNGLGLISLNEMVVAPRPNYAWRALVTEHRR